METKSLTSFNTAIRSACRGIFNGSLESMAGADALFSAIRRGLTQAWYEGAKEYGVKPSELTEEELKRLEQMIGDNFQYVGRFVDWINQVKAKDGKLESVF